jgi:hypothetical protein
VSVLQRAADALGRPNGRGLSSRKLDRAIVEQEAHIASHADWANVRMAKARIKRRERWTTIFNCLVFVAIVIFVIWLLSSDGSGGSGGGGAAAHNCWTDPRTGQIVQCEAP